MADDRPADDEHPLSVRLDVYLDRQPVCGRLRSEVGDDERFVGWLGFVETLTRMLERQRPPAR